MARKVIVMIRSLLARCYMLQIIACYYSSCISCALRNISTLLCIAHHFVHYVILLLCSLLLIN